MSICAYAYAYAVLMHHGLTNETVNMAQVDAANLYHSYAQNHTTKTYLDAYAMAETRRAGQTDRHRAGQTDRHT